MNKKMIVIFLGAVVVLVLVISAVFYATDGDEQQVACTQEAKQCPDGSYVGRTGPNCEFAACPAVGAEERKFFGFLRATNGGQLEIDEIEFLSGDEARRLGVEDTGCAPEKIEECIPSMNNGFYIRNIDQSTRAYTLADDAEVIILTNLGSPDLGPITMAEFLSKFPRPDIVQPFSFTAKGDAITRVEEQYTP